MCYTTLSYIRLDKKHYHKCQHFYYIAILFSLSKNKKFMEGTQDAMPSIFVNSMLDWASWTSWVEHPKIKIGYHECLRNKYICDRSGYKHEISNYFTKTRLVPLLGYSIMTPKSSIPNWNHESLSLLNRKSTDSFSAVGSIFLLEIIIIIIIHN